MTVKKKQNGNFDNCATISPQRIFNGFFAQKWRLIVFTSITNVILIGFWIFRHLKKEKKTIRLIIYFARNFEKGSNVYNRCVYTPVSNDIEVPIRNENKKKYSNAYVSN